MLTPKKPNALAPHPYTLWKLASILVVSGMTLITLISFYFIYTLVFSTIDLQGEVARRAAEPRITPLDNDGLTKAEKALAAKTATSTLQSGQVRTIFVYTSSTPILYAPSSTTTPNASSTR